MARTEAGAKWRDVITAAHPHGLAPLNGFSGTVGSLATCSAAASDGWRASTAPPLAAFDLPNW